MISVDNIGSGESYRFVLSPNCSISWRELLPFSGLEMLALGIGLYVTSRKVYRREVITLDPQCTRIEKGVQRADQIWEFKTAWVRVVDECRGGRGARRRLAIGMSGESVEVGSFLANWEKDALAFQLKDCIIRV